jgi:hypothetical protein
MLAVVFGTVGILCVPVVLFVALRLFASFPESRPVRVAISAPQQATLRRVEPQPIAARRLEITDGSHIIEAR